MVTIRSPGGRLEGVLATLGERYAVDARGRIVGLRGAEGDAPRFVFARTREGCVWRIHANLAEAMVAKIARWAGREKALAPGEPRPPLPPERLVLIERELGARGDGSEGSPATRRETVELDGRLEAEIWVID